MSSSGERGQKTLGRRVGLSGIGVHSGLPVSITLCPAVADSGIVFLRSDTEIPARTHAVASTELCTVLGAEKGKTVATVEHLLAAFAGLGVDNAIVEVDGAEVPVMDGSSATFVDAIDSAGLRMQGAPRRFIRIDETVRVECGAGFAEFCPYPRTRLEISIDYDCSVVGQQRLALDLTPKHFRKKIARARTFGYVRDVEKLWAAGFALGSSLENSIVIGEHGVVNPEGLRFPDEFVRHKMLDAIGDLALAGAPIRGLYRSHRGGHKLNALALSTLLSRTDAWTLVSEPLPREVREPRAEIALGAAAFAPEVR